MRILFADDDPFFLKIALDILVGAGHEVFVAQNGRAALEASVKYKPELIILDIVMPGFLGTEVTEHLRRYSKTARVPILLVSSRIADMGGEESAEEFRADGFLKKPFQPEELLEKVASLAGHSSQFGTPPKND